MYKKIFIPLFLIFVYHFTDAQNVSVRGKFLNDSVKIGEQVPFTLSATYPKSADIVFPDSTYSFKPFEFQKKKFFNTITKDSLSYDSAVYFLSTYEIDSIQSLKMPVFVVHGKDCTAVFTSMDTIRLVEMISTVPDSVTAEKLPLKTNTAYQKVKWLLNYPLILIIGGILLIILAAAWLLFGKRMKKYFLLKKLQKNHRAFLVRFNSLADQSKAKHVEEALTEWKKYMETLISKPFTKFTSKEILAQEGDEILGNALYSMDRLIYGGITESADESFAVLRKYTDQQYQKKMEEVKNG